MSATPEDLAAVAADDALIDALASARMTDDTDAVIRLLARYRREVHAQPIPELVSTEHAMAVIAAARPRRRHHAVVAVVLAITAAALILACVLGVAAADARPGEPLHPLRELLYGGAR